jgi:hypothetical protein
VPWEVEQPVDLHDGHLLGAGRHLLDRLPRLDVALLDHAQIEPGPPVRHEQRRDPRVVHPQPDAVAGDARLGDLEQRPADPEAVADADVLVREALDGEVLAELPEHEVAAPELALPIAIGLVLVDEDGPLLAAVAGLVALPVAVEVEPPGPHRSLHRVLEHAREHRAPPPRHVLRHGDVDGEQGGRHASFLIHLVEVSLTANPARSYTPSAPVAFSVSTVSTARS